MWLFDNLFLDANTPITINDGVDHSKDIVQNIVDPTFVDPKPGDMPTGGTGDDGSTGWKKDDTKKDDSLVNLFWDSHKEEAEAAMTLHPEPPKDIALEIWHTRDIPVSSSLDPAVTFDIGWDISFDIGWDIQEIPNTIVNLWTPSWSIAIAGNISISSTENILPEIQTLDAISHEKSISTSHNTWVLPDKMGEDISSNNSLFSLLNTPAPILAPVSEIQNEGVSSVSISSWGWSSEVPVISSVFPSLFEDTKAISSSEPRGGISAWVISSWMETLGLGWPAILSSIDHRDILWETSSLTHLGIPETPSFRESERIHLSSSSKLKSKLSQFLGELESMEVWDESQKNHKMQQIDMCRMRISEIRIEYDARIHGLQWEMQSLEREVRDMDSEKNHIKTVIETFQKELDMA